MWLLLLLPLGLLAYAATRDKAPRLVEPDPQTGITRGFAPHPVTGKSGREWDARIVLVNGDDRLVEVIDPKAARMVIRYVDQRGGGRYLAALNDRATVGEIESALSDFGVTGPIPKRGEASPSPALKDGQVNVAAGSYVANVDVPFPASLVVTASLLERGLADKGFIDSRVTTERPAGWPLPGEADYYVRTYWRGAPQAFDKPKAVTAYRKVKG